MNIKKNKKVFEKNLPKLLAGHHSIMKFFTSLAKFLPISEISPSVLSSLAIDDRNKDSG